MRIAAVLSALTLAACSPRSGDVPDDSVAGADNLAPSSEVRTYAQFVRGCPPTLANPPAARAVFDVHVRGQGEDSASARSSEIVRAIERLGGRVVHRFHVGVVRAELDTSSARALATGPGMLADMAEQARDTGNRRLAVQITFNRPATALDSASVARLGGAPGPIVGTRNTLYATVADSAIPGIVAMATVKDIRTRIPRCGRPG